MKPFSAEEYETELIEKYWIEPENIKYYTGRIYSFLKYSKDSENLSESKEDYLSDLSLRLKLWQVNQAEKAITLYFSMYQDDIHSKKKPLDQSNEIDLMRSLRDEIRLQNKSLQTERTYISWNRRFYQYADLESPDLLDQSHVRDFLTYLTVKENVSMSTHKLAFNAILFMFRFILDKKIENLDTVVFSRKQKKLPVVLTRNEGKTVISNMKHPYQLMAKLIYGGGLRLSECLELRIKDVDFDNSILTVRSGKGNKDRQTLLSSQLIPELGVHLINMSASVLNCRKTPE